MRENIVRNKSFHFAVRIVKLYNHLCNEKREFVLSKQLLRSGTAIGAMVREAEHAESRPDFRHKMAIAQKETNECVYWLELLKETGYLTREEFDSINIDAVENLKIITSIIKTAKSNG